MAFKAESDDVRSSLSYKLRKLLGWAGAGVLCTDPYVSDPRLVPSRRCSQRRISSSSASRTARTVRSSLAGATSSTCGAPALEGIRL